MTTNRRRRAWNDVLVNRIITSGSGTAPIDLLVDAPPRDVATVVRLIGDFTVLPDDRNAAIDSVMQIDLGVGVASDEAFVATVVPDPNVQAEYPALGWLYVTTMVMSINNSSGTVESYTFPTIHFDVGANRKVDKGTLYLAVNNTLADGSGISVRFIGRMRSLCLI